MQADMGLWKFSSGNAWEDQPAQLRGCSMVARLVGLGWPFSSSSNGRAGFPV
jgi:hypothetical protein